MDERHPWRPVKVRLLLLLGALLEACRAFAEPPSLGIAACWLLSAACCWHLAETLFQVIGVFALKAMPFPTEICPWVGLAPLGKLRAHPDANKRPGSGNVLGCLGTPFCHCTVSQALFLAELRHYGMTAWACMYVLGNGCRHFCYSLTMMLLCGEACTLSHIALGAVLPATGLLTSSLRVCSQSCT